MTKTRPAPPTADLLLSDHLSDHQRVEASIFRSLGERRSARARRRNSPSPIWDSIETRVFAAATAVWEDARPGEELADVCAGLLALCAFLARELEVTESLDLDPTGEWRRLELVAPRALAALDAVAPVREDVTLRPVARAFAELRAELSAATRFVGCRAA